MTASSLAAGPKTAARGERFFVFMALILLAIVAGGFGGVQVSPNGFITRPIGPLVAVHAAFQMAWFALLVTQPWLVSAGNIRVHMQIGAVSALVALGVFVSGFLTTRGAYADPTWFIGSWSREASTMLPFLDMTTFALAYGLAIAFRRVPATHKRLMLLAGLFMIDPAMARLIAATGAPPPLIPLTELALFSSLLMYDWRTLGRPHWASVMGLAVFIIAMALKMVVAEWPIWTDTLVPLLFG